MRQLIMDYYSMQMKTSNKSKLLHLMSISQHQQQEEKNQKKDYSSLHLLQILQ